MELTLKKMFSEGIKSDNPRLRKSMCTQFSKKEEWVREYVVNSSDAGASICVISGYEEDDSITVVVWDDGSGMTIKGVTDFFTLFRSDKEFNIQTIGTHGIGKLSVAAIEGQQKLTIISSTGTECCKAEAGNLLADDPIRIYPVAANSRERGTTFFITFKKRDSLKAEMERLKAILEKYVPFLVMTIEIQIPREEEDEFGTTEIIRINQPWPGDLHFCRNYQQLYEEKKFEIVLGLGKTMQAIYQHKVLISENLYNMVVNPEEDAFQIPGLTVMVNSPDFKLPFGRHKLMNEDIIPVVRSLVRKLLPGFYTEVLNLYKTNDLQSYNFSNYSFFQLTGALLKADYNKSCPWFFAPVLKTVQQKLVSFADLDDAVKQGQKVYFSNEEAGVDYSVFKGIVLEKEQPAYCSDLINKYFSSELVDLSSGSEVIEKPGDRAELTEKERKLEQNLGFHPSVFKQSNREENPNSEFGSGFDSSFSPKHADKDAAVKELKNADRQLKMVRWRVTHLVEKDGTTPCTSRLFLFRQNTVLLNLYHPVIRELIELTEYNAALAGHWSMAMVLSDKNNIMEHLTPETREDLLILDAMAKIDGFKSGYTRSSYRDSFDDLLGRFMDLDLN